jgi:hypothetical protein
LLASPLVHVWQADEGFRLARSRNRAIAAARGDYVIIVDGDLVLHRHFVGDHLRAARHGCFIQGAAIRASMTARVFQRRHVFLLGHMRSYSSVLSHILGSHPQIDGYCETHIKYRTRFDLWRLHHRVKKLTGDPLSGDYVLDKVLHDYPIARSILDSSRTRGIVLVRRPAASVRSIIEMGLTHSSIAWHRNFEQVARYYETRLAGLLRLAEALRGRVVFLQAERLLFSPRPVLDQLATFLELQSPLETEYRCFAHTGEPGFGDPSEAISTGRITPTARASQTAVSLPRPLIIRLQNAYDFWCGAISRSCPAISGSETTAYSNQLPG